MSTKRLSALEVTIWITLLLFVLLALSPYVIGYRAKSDYTNLINQMSKISQLDLQVLKYNQGFFSSQATVSLHLPHYSEAVLFNEEIVHGPVYLGLISQGKSPFVAAVINGELDMEAAQLKKFENILSGSSPVLYQHLIGFTGDVDSQVYMPAIKTLVQEGAESIRLESSGAIYTQFLSSADGSVKGEISVPSFKVQKDTFDMLLKDSVVSFSGRKGKSQLMIGDSVVSVGVLNIDSADEQFAVRKLIVHSISSEEGELINSGAQLSAREVLASNQKFGPVALNISLNGLNANSLLQIEKMKIALDNQLEQGVPAEKINRLMMNQLIVIIPDLIKQIEANINPLSISSELGRLEADMQFKLDGVEGDVSTNPLLMVNAINFDLNMSIDEPLIRKLIAWHLNNTADDQASFKAMGARSTNMHKLMSKKVDDNLRALMEVNWLVKDEGIYLSKISMRKGELLINDISVDALQQIMSTVSGDNGASVQ
jgi:uncharacterized protein YdgA (DUF945 family)